MPDVPFAVGDRVRVLVKDDFIPTVVGHVVHVWPDAGATDPVVKVKVFKPVGAKYLTFRGYGLHQLEHVD